MKKEYILFVLSCCLYMIATVGTNNGAGVFLVPLAEKLSVGRGTISIGEMVCTTTAGLFTAFTPRVIRKFGLRPVLIFGAVVYGGLTAVVGFLPNYLFLLIVNFFRGIAFICISSPIIISAISNWFPANGASMVGIVLSCSGLGGAVLSPVFTNIVAQYGVEYGFVVEGIICFILLIPAIIFIHSKPADANLQPYYGATKSNKEVKERFSYNIPFSINNTYFYCLAAMIFLLGMISCSSSHLAGYGLSLNLVTTSAYMLSSFMIGNVVFKILVGKICDSLGDKYGMPAAFGFTAFGLSIIIFLPKTPVLLIIGSFFFGASCCSQVAESALIRYIYGSKNFDDIIAGLVAVSAVSAFSSSFVGFVYDVFGDYIYGFLIEFILCFVGIGLNMIVVNKSKKETINN